VKTLEILFLTENTTNYDCLLSSFWVGFFLTLNKAGTADLHILWATFRVHSHPEESLITTVVSPWWEPLHYSTNSFWTF